MNNYFDIIDLPHHQSRKHAHMSGSGRAAQFAPFAALSGYDEAVAEEARLTSDKYQLDEEALERLNNELKQIMMNINERPLVVIIRFVPDEKKTGGEYKAFSGRVRRVDECLRKIVFTDGTEIAFDDILDIRLPDDFDSVNW